MPAQKTRLDAKLRPRRSTRFFPNPRFGLGARWYFQIRVANRLLPTRKLIWDEASRAVWTLASAVSVATYLALRGAVRQNRWDCDAG